MGQDKDHFFGDKHTTVPTPDDPKCSVCGLLKHDHVVTEKGHRCAGGDVPQWAAVAKVKNGNGDGKPADVIQ